MNVSAEQIEKELKSASEDDLRRNREKRANYWREVGLSSKVGPLPLESVFLFLAVLVFPSYYTLGAVILFLVIYTIANSKGLSMRQLVYLIQSFLRGRKMTRKITFMGYDIR